MPLFYDLFLNSRPFLCGFASVSMNDVLMSGSDFPAARRRPTGAGVSDRSVGDLCTLDQICQRNDIPPKPSTGDAVLTTRGSAPAPAASRATATPLLLPLLGLDLRDRLLSGLLKTATGLLLLLLFSLPPSSALLPVRMRRLFFRRHATGG